VRAVDRGALREEWARALLCGPGIVVRKGACADLAVLDRARDMFGKMIEAERASGAGGGDHFAKPGANDRVWNALQKHCLTDPEGFALYYGNICLALVSTAWLGPHYQFTAQVNRLQHVKEPLSGAVSNGLLGLAGNPVRREKTRGPEHLAAFLRRARLAGRPDLRRSPAAVQIVHQAFEKACLDALPVRCYAANQRTLVQVDEADMRLRGWSFIYKELCELLRQWCFSPAFFHFFNPFDEAAVIDGKKQGQILSRVAKKASITSSRLQ